MATYKQLTTRAGGVFNASQFISPNEEVSAAGEGSGIINLGLYLQVNGSNSMSANLNTPGLVLYGDQSKIRFADGSEMASLADAISNSSVTFTGNEQVLAISHDVASSTTTISGTTVINNLQTNNVDMSLLESLTSEVQPELDKLDRLTNVTYDAASHLTSISGSTYVANMVAGNFNSAHLSGTLGNVQSQITSHGATLTSNANTLVDHAALLEAHGSLLDDHSATISDNYIELTERADAVDAKTADITHDVPSLLTTIANGCFINELTCGNFDTGLLETLVLEPQPELEKLTNMTYNPAAELTSVSGAMYVNNISCGNIDTAHLAGTTSHVQTQITTLGATVTSQGYQIAKNMEDIADNDIAVNTRITLDQKQVWCMSWDKTYTDFVYGTNGTGGESSGDNLNLSDIGIIARGSAVSFVMPGHNVAGGRIVIVNPSATIRNSIGSPDGLTIGDNRIFKVTCDVEVRPSNANGGKQVRLEYFTVQLYWSNVGQTSLDNNRADFSMREKVLVDTANINEANVQPAFAHHLHYEQMLMTTGTGFDLYSKITPIIRYKGNVMNDASKTVKIHMDVNVVEV